MQLCMPGLRFLIIMYYHSYMIDLPDALLSIAAGLNAVLGFLILRQERNNITGTLYFLNILSILSWIAAALTYRNITDENLLFTTTQVLYIAPTVIASTFLLFALYFPNKEKVSITRNFLLVFFPNILITIIILIPGLIISDVTEIDGGENIIEFGDYYYIYAFYIITYFGSGIGILYYRYLHTKKPVEYRQIFSLLLVYFLATTLAFITNLFLPWFGYFELNWLGQVFTLLMVLGVAYAIYQHKLFETKVILTELLVLVLLVFLFVQVLLSKEPTDTAIGVTVFIVTAIVGILLIRNVNKEIQNRLEIEKLMAGLARANRRLQAMDKQKSEFVSIASHQLRSPLTAIRGYASMLLEGSYGTFPSKAQKPLETIAESARMMASSIEDYLSVSRIESGNMKFDYSDFRLDEQAERVTDSLRQEATRSGLLLLFKKDLTSRSVVHADQGKVEQILHNLINNALKYTPKGSITVFLHDDTKAEKIFVEVIDTGIGMSEATQENIFHKFQRADNASSVNVHGTGLGLYVAKRMANEMKGDVCGFSEGEGKGSHFILELPLVH